MQAVECSTEANTIHIVIERNALNTALLAQVNEYLHGLMQPLEATSTIAASTITASGLRSLSPNERKRIIAEQFARASELYTLHSTRKTLTRLWKMLSLCVWKHHKTHKSVTKIYQHTTQLPCKLAHISFRPKELAVQDRA